MKIEKLFRVEEIMGPSVHLLPKRLQPWSLTIPRRKRREWSFCFSEDDVENVLTHVILEMNNQYISICTAQF